MVQRGGDNTIPELVKGYDGRLNEMADNVTTIKQEFETCKKFQDEMKERLNEVKNKLTQLIEFETLMF